MPSQNAVNSSVRPEGSSPDLARKRRLRLKRRPLMKRRPRFISAGVMLFVAALALGLLLRIPVLYNSVFNFNSDEAVNALVIKHMMQGRGFSFFNWDTTYYGIVEGLFAVPFTALFGYEPLSFKLSAVVGYLILQVSLFLLGRRLFRTSAGLMTASTLALFSPMLIWWSTLASGGFCLIAGWGTITVLHVYHLVRKPSLARVALLGWLLGFGIYIYQLYFVYVAALCAALALVLGRELARPAGFGRVKRLFEAFSPGRAVKWLHAFAGAFVLGCAPKIVAALSGVSSSKQPSFGFAVPFVVLGNIKLLLRRCLPVFFGVNIFGEPMLLEWSGPNFPLWAETGYLAFFMAAWLWGAYAVWRDDERAGRSARARRVILLILVLLPVVNVLLFVLSTNPQDMLSNRYLLPSLTSLTVLAGGMIVRLGRRSKAAALLLACAVLAFGLSKSVAWMVNQKNLTTGLRLVSKHEPLDDVLGLLRQKGVRGAFSDYWTAYKATFLSREEILVSSIRIWDRNPELTRAVRALPTAAYIFTAPSRQEDAFRERLQDYSIPYERHLIDKYAVYLSPTGSSLGRAELGPLPQFNSALMVENAPSTLRVGQHVQIKISVRNMTDSVWSAEGGDEGEYRVDGSYRWLNKDGGPVGAGDRALFQSDVHPGETEGLVLEVNAPLRPGQYTLVFTLVQERVVWFCDVGGGEVRVPVLVISG